jgi:hypothetical protein
LEILGSDLGKYMHFDIWNGGKYLPHFCHKNTGYEPYLFVLLFCHMPVQVVLEAVRCREGLALTLTALIGLLS